MRKYVSTPGKGIDELRFSRQQQTVTKISTFLAVSTVPAHILAYAALSICIQAFSDLLISAAFLFLDINDLPSKYVFNVIHMIFNNVMAGMEYISTSHANHSSTTCLFENKTLWKQCTNLQLSSRPYLVLLLF